ncbi:dethiobiotin synthase [Neptuniibacter sp. CAU 1671]|uniref:dethiobiotin synthase n=1 Tax=Neptuniibacter sp. CAU 1671 TaxID=3032593 RepID=UPI0023DAAADE|nr:dethiobiotin synthase [Neptuniibacter sp. CAU 1671]MDF2181471.1 dethiobiotin synthase [Neptuniibacter sp. CAU 1671]
MAKQAYFVTGTDTDAGKTVVSAGLLQAGNNRGWKTLGLKPIAAGCEETPDGLRNSDALLLQQTASVELSYDQVNPVSFAPPIAPHIAAMQLRRQLSADRIAAYCRGALMQSADLAIIEGAGGWRVPLSYRETLAAVPRLLELPVILVVGMKLGCINHALLTAESIARDGLPLAGWVANRVDPDMACYEENMASLKAMLRAPLLGEVPWLSSPEPAAVATHLDLDKLAVQ